MREGRIAEITQILAWYEYINDVILDHLDDNIKSTDRSGVWRYLISFKVKLTMTTVLISSFYSESPSGYREYWHSVCLRHSVPDNRGCHTEEFYQVSHYNLYNLA